MLFVETIGPDPTVIADAGALRQFRNLNSAFRGSVRSTVLGLVRDCRQAREVVSRSVHATATDELGAVGYAHPTLGPDGSVVAMQLRFGTERPAKPEPIGVWDWNLSPVDRPPQLLLSEEFLDLYAFARDFRDRTVYGPADFFTRVVRISDLLDLDHKIKNSAVGDHSTGTFIIRTDAGELRELHYAQRCIESQNGLRLRGVCRDVTNINPTRLRRQLVENTLLGEVFDLHGVFGAIGDITYPAAPIVLKWLTPHPRGLGHGASTGQTPSVHPDDLPTVFQMISAMRERPHEQATATVRARRAGGGWMRATVTARLLDPRISMSIVVALVFPETISTTEEG